ncbi:MAG: hypothetical protein M5U19_21475 [Microthrixaceae bacterium]|nr:hypothetical protein [Microthrixaceae bacterium]
MSRRVGHGADTTNRRVGHGAVSEAARGALLVAAKDLRLERRTKVATAQMLPFALLVLLLFAFALDPDRGC